MKKLTLFLAVLALLAAPVHPSLAADAAKEPIKIGEMFCYTGCPDVARPWHNGLKMAVDEVNAVGGILNRPLELISRDDKGNPSEAIKVMEELKSRDGVKIVTGTLMSHTSLAASSFAKQNDVLFVKGHDASSSLTAEHGHDLYMQYGAPTNIYSRVLAEKIAPFNKKRWAFISSDFETGHVFVEEFQNALKKFDPSVEFLPVHWFPLGKMEAGPIAQAVARSKPDAIFAFVSLSDYARLVREGTKRKLFEGRLVVSPVAGYSANIDPLGREAPVGWWTGSGYPTEQIKDAKHRKFIDSYKALYNEEPDLLSLHAYSTMKIIAESISTAGSDDPHKVRDVMLKNSFAMPDADITFRPDGLSNHGTWIGKTGFYNGKPTVLDAEYVVPDKYLPTVEENMNSRKGQK